MTIESTPQAFMVLLNERGIYKKLGVDRSTVSNWKRALAGQDCRNMPSLDKMEEMLSRYGAKVVSEKIWQIEP
jgi:hypothetical protein